MPLEQTQLDRIEANLEKVVDFCEKAEALMNVMTGGKSAKLLMAIKAKRSS